MRSVGLIGLQFAVVTCLVSASCSRTLYDFVMEQSQKDEDPPAVPDDAKAAHETSLAAKPQADAPERFVGVLADEAVQRVVQRHRNEVSFCREQEPRARAEPRPVEVKFVVLATGSVMSAVVEHPNQDLELAKVEACVARAVRRWTFPPPTGGSAKLSYVFAP